MTENYVRAETRQCLSALKFWGELPKGVPNDELYSQNEIRTFLEKLDWNKPWQAGSHFSHMMFFQNLAMQI